MAKFLIALMWNNQYWYFLKDNNEQTIFRSNEGYYSKNACENAIASIKAHEVNDANFAKMISITGKYYFFLKAFNGEIIARSEEYETPSERDNWIEEVKRIVFDASVEDISDEGPRLFPL